MKKQIGVIIGALALASLASCGGNGGAKKNENGISKDITAALNDKGYVGNESGTINPNDYKNTDAYRKVRNADELIEALNDARWDYSATQKEITSVGGYIERNNCRKNATNWQSAITKGLYIKNADGTYTKIPADVPYDPNDTTYLTDMTSPKKMVYYEDTTYATCNYEQTLNKAGSVRVIEIADDIDLGYKQISADAKAYTNIVHNFAGEHEDNFIMSSMYKKSGMSQIFVERTNDLIIYSKYGAKITHGGFKLNYCKNVTFRNLEMDEMWQWEDAASPDTSSVGDYDSEGWAYFKIGYSDDIWIDHCTFGKSFDGQIDIANPFYGSIGTYKSAPYGADGSSDVHISWCDFKGGSDDKDGYLYKMMAEIEAEYQAGMKNYLYYNALRSKYSFEDILYGVAIPQKKAFLDGDSGTEYYYNTNLRVSIANCKFTNVEDRIPKVRGGVAYMYNTVVDNSEYYEYRSHFYEGSTNKAKGLVANVNSNWKCALTSQCILAGNGASVAAKNCIFKGIDNLLYNNDNELTNVSGMYSTTKRGGYDIQNSSYQKGASDPVITSDFVNKSPTVLTEIDFDWKTPNGREPFAVEVLDLSKLEERLLNEVYGIGVHADFTKLI